MQLTFVIKESDSWDNPDVRALAKVLKNLGIKEIKEVDERVGVHLLIVHANTDRYEKDDLPRIAAEKRVAYVQYTRGKEKGPGEDGCRLYELSDLIARFKSVNPPATKDSLLAALGAASIELKWLPAIAILCQGYVAVLAESVSIPSAALEHMGWGTLKTNNELCADIVPELATHRDEVQGTKWWSTVLGEDKNTLTERLQDEWAKDRKLPTTVSDLVNAIYDGDGLSAEIVAAAYLAIADRLEGKSCR